MTSRSTCRNSQSMRPGPMLLAAVAFANLSGCPSQQSSATNCSDRSGGAAAYFECAGDGKTDQTKSPKIVAFRAQINKLTLSQTIHSETKDPAAAKKGSKP
jgi:hypothetical protein